MKYQSKLAEKLTEKVPIVNYKVHAANVQYASDRGEDKDIKKYGFLVVDADQLIRGYDFDDVEDAAEYYDIKNIPISSLIATQPDIGEKNLASHMKDTWLGPITVFTYKGKNYINNGHHRVVAQKLLGKTTIPAMVVPVEGSWRSSFPND